LGRSLFANWCREQGFTRSADTLPAAAAAVVVVLAKDSKARLYSVAQSAA